MSHTITVLELRSESAGVVGYGRDPDEAAAHSGYSEEPDDIQLSEVEVADLPASHDGVSEAVATAICAFHIEERRRAS